MHENIIYGKNGEDVGVQLLNIILRQYLYVVSWAHNTEFSVIKYMKYKNICLFFYNFEIWFWNIPTMLYCFLFHYITTKTPILTHLPILLCNIKYCINYMIFTFVSPSSCINLSICLVVILSTIFLLSLISSTIIWATLIPIPPWQNIKDRIIKIKITSMCFNYSIINLA